MRRTKLAFVGFVAAGNSMWHQVLDDLCLVVTDQSATTCDSSYAPKVPSTTPYYKVLKSATPVLFCTTKYYSDRNDVRTTSIQYYSVLQSTSTHYRTTIRTTPILRCILERILQYYSVLQSTTPHYKALLRPKRRQNDVHPVLLRTQSNTPTVRPPKRCQNDVHPVLSPYYKVLQYY